MHANLSICIVAAIKERWSTKAMASFGESFYVKHFKALWVFGWTSKANQTKINFQLTVKYG